MDRITFEGQPGCIGLVNDTVDLVLTTAIGPRVLRYGFRGGANVLGSARDDSTATPFGPWKPVGGHRLWVAPELMPGSYAPDDAALNCEVETERSVRLVQPVDASGIEKRLRVILADTGPGVTLEHEIVNRTCWPIQVAAWALTVVAPGARAVMPQAPFRSHDDQLQPARPIVLWPFTNLADPRFAIGSRLVQLTARPEFTSPQKVGMANASGWCAAIHEDVIFVKRFAHDTAASYPDFGCNNEVYTAGAFIEVETLGPLTLLQPGDGTLHVERWTLFKQQVPEDDSAAANTLESLIRRR